MTATTPRTGAPGPWESGPRGSGPGDLTGPSAAGSDHATRLGGLQAVLFDLDGLLIDSEGLWLEVETEVMSWLGAPWGPEHQERMIGGSLDRAVAYMLALAGPVAPPAEVGRRLLDGMAGRLAGQVPLMPGAKELLTQAQSAGVPCALVSSSHRRLMEHALDGIGRDHFQVTVAGDEVTLTKPDPEPYLTAARLLGADPRHCVALEDSPSGVAAAVAAGCVTVAVPGRVPVPPAPGHVVIGSLGDIDLAWLAALPR